MRKVLLTLAVFMSSTALAQVLNVASIEKVNLPAVGEHLIAGISPKGDYILLTGSQLCGLAKYDLKTGRSEVLSSAWGAGNGAKISKDGKNIVYREDSFFKGLRYSSLEQKNLSTGAKIKLMNSSRNLQTVDLQGGNAMIVSGNRLTKKVFTKSLPTNNVAPVVSINNRQLMITRNGITRVLSPNGTEYSYIWPSISPDGKKICYYVCGVGCFVCNVDGTNVKQMGELRAARWYDNNILVGMNDIDDGHTITASTIVAKNLKGESQILTDSSIIAMYPYASVEGKKIAFSTFGGEVYIINVK